MLKKKEKRQVNAPEIAWYFAEYLTALTYGWIMAQSEKKGNTTLPSANIFYKELDYCRHCGNEALGLL